MDNQKIGAFIAAMRKERGLTQKELGSRLHVSDRAVSKWERGLNLPDAALFEPLCKELDISVIELLRGERAEATVPALERVVEETVALAEKKERAARRNRWALKTLLVLVLLGAALLGWLGWRYVQQQRYYAQDTVIPHLALAYRGAYQTSVINPRWGGHHAPLNSDGSVSDADLRVCFPLDSITIQQMIPVRAEELGFLSMHFGLSFEKPGLEVQVVRWPESAIGTQVTLEDGEQVEFRESRYSPLENHPLTYQFHVDSGYVYSIVFLWGEDYYVEFPFRALD